VLLALQVTSVQVEPTTVPTSVKQVTTATQELQLKICLSTCALWVTIALKVLNSLLSALLVNSQRRELAVKLDVLSVPLDTTASEK
jgi:ABC-type transport system involved in cytochrome c biogenesis permease component